MIAPIHYRQMIATIAQDWSYNGLVNDSHYWGKKLVMSHLTIVLPLYLPSFHPKRTWGGSKPVASNSLRSNSSVSLGVEFYCKITLNLHLRSRWFHRKRWISVDPAPHFWPSASHLVWWFQTWLDYMLLFSIIKKGCHPKPIDFHSIIFQDGFLSTNQIQTMCFLVSQSLAGATFSWGRNP